MIKSIKLLIKILNKTKWLLFLITFLIKKRVYGCVHFLSSMKFGHYDMTSFIFFVNMTKTLIKIILELIKFYKLYKSDITLLYLSVIFNCYKVSWARKKKK